MHTCRVTSASLVTTVVPRRVVFTHSLSLSAINRLQTHCDRNFFTVDITFFYSLYKLQCANRVHSGDRVRRLRNSYTWEGWLAGGWQVGWLMGHTICTMYLSLVAN